MKILYPLAFILVFIGFTQAQHDWVSGSVVLNTNKVLVGEISKKPIHDLILVKSSEGIRALPAHQVSYYRFYDGDADINRQFLSIKSHDFFETAKFFEIVIQGNIKVLRRYHKKTAENEVNEAYDFDYFTLYDNTLVPLGQFKKKVYPKLMEKYPIEMSTFISTSQSHHTSTESTFCIIKQFNSTDGKSNLLRSRT
jgi:hypothetical protein